MTSQRLNSLMNNNQLENLPLEISQGLGIFQSLRFSSQKIEDPKISNLSFKMENDTSLKSEIEKTFKELDSCEYFLSF